MIGFLAKVRGVPVYQDSTLSEGDTWLLDMEYYRIADAAGVWRRPSGLPSKGLLCLIPQSLTDMDFITQAVNALLAERLGYEETNKTIDTRYNVFARDSRRLKG